MNGIKLSIIPPGFRLTGGLSPFAHDIHLSNCSIEFLEDGNTLDIRLHIWLDDLAIGLEKAGIGDLLLYTGHDVENADEKLMEYLRANMSLKINGKPAQFKWVKKEPSEDLLAAWIHLEIKNIQSLNSIKVKNSILLDVYDDQKNIVHIKREDGRQVYLIFNEADQEEEVFF